LKVGPLFGFWIDPATKNINSFVTPNKTADSSDETCDDDCSLREAFTATSPSEILYLPEGVYTLTEGELLIDKSLIMLGAGPGKTIIQAAENLDASTHRVLNVTSSNVTISGVTIRHGKATAEKVDVGRDQPALAAGYGQEGGGIFINRGQLHLDNSLVEVNAAGRGGIFNHFGELTLTHSTVAANLAQERCPCSGGGIQNRLGAVTVEWTTISGNESSGSGGAIYNNTLASDPMNLMNITISGNTADSDGGGIVSSTSGGRLMIVNGTISDNHFRAHGGGIFTIDFGTANPQGPDIVNTVVAGNTAATGPDCFGTITSLGHNLLESSDRCTLTLTVGDIVEVAPLLGPLTDNGGRTLTHALLPESAAIGAGDDSYARDDDQRGINRPQGLATDIGAYEK
jgi:hypothetical protein